MPKAHSAKVCPIVDEPEHGIGHAVRLGRFLTLISQQMLDIRREVGNERFVPIIDPLSAGLRKLPLRGDELVPNSHIWIHKTRHHVLSRPMPADAGPTPPSSAARRRQRWDRRR